MDYENKERPKHGLAVSLDGSENNGFRLILDDIESVKGVGAASWKPVGFYTISPEFGLDELTEIGLSDDQLKDIGLSVVVRLLALNGLFK